MNTKLSSGAMAGPGEIYSVPDLYCFEDLPDFELGTNSHLYDDPTSTKDSSVRLNLDSNSQCAVCSSSLCDDRQSESFIHLQNTPRSQWDPNGGVSYHDIWCDDSSWKFTSSSEEEDSQATQCSSLSSSTPFPSLVPHEVTDINDTQLQAVSSGASPQDAVESQNESSENFEMSDEDIFADSPSATPRPVPERFDDIEDFALWELSQMSSQSSQSSAFADDLEDSRLVPTLQTILQHHRHSAGDQVAASLETDDTSENEERQRNGLLFNSTCAAAEQVVPNWHTEE